MIVWIFKDDDGEITLFKTQEGALKYFYECLKIFGMDDTKRLEAISQMKEKDYWREYQIYSTEVYD